MTGSAPLTRSLTVARVCAAAATVLSIVGAVLFFVTIGAPDGVTLATQIAQLVVVPILLISAFAAAMMFFDRFGLIRSVALSALSAMAAVAGLMAVRAWGAGFAAADEGRPATAMGSTLELVWAGLAWVLWAAVIALCLAPFITALRPAALRYSTGVLASVIAAPLVGLWFLAPVSGAVTAAGALTWLLLLGAGQPAEQPRVVPVMSRVRPIADQPRRVAALAAISTSGGVAGTVIALAGSTIPALAPLGMDATEAMRLGLAVGAAAAFTLVPVAVPRVQAVPELIAALTLSGSVVAVMLAYLLPGSGGDQSFALLAISIVFAGSAAGILVPRWLRIDLSRPVLVGAAAGVLYAASIGFVVASMLTFLLPVIGMTLLIIAARTLRTRQTIVTA